MGNRVITNADELVPWMDEHRWFGVGSLLAVHAPRAEGALPERVVLDLETVVRDGGWQAGNMQTIRTVRLEAQEVREWASDVVPEGFPYRFVGDGLYPVEGEEGVAIEIAAPEDPWSLLVCGRLVVVETKEREQRIAPFASPSSTYTAVPRGALPTPGAWVEAYRARGVEVAWRYYAGEARPPESVPQLDYTGWYLQLPGRIPANKYGLFFAWAKPKGEGFELMVEIDDKEARDALWPVACSMLAEFPEATIHCGNCYFTAAEWRRFLEDGTFPVPA